MDTEVGSKGSRLMKLCSANHALKGSLSGVDTQVRAEVAPLVKLLVADAALVRLLPGMYSEVHRECTLSGTKFMTHCTFVPHCEA